MTSYTATSTNPRRVAVYVRISRDPDETELGVQDQLKDLRVLAEALGWVVAVEYNENDVSAWKKRRVMVDSQVRYRVIRPLWTEMLAGARAGLFDAILVLDLDRMAREPRDVEDLIELVNHHGVEVRSLTGTADLKPGGDVLMPRVMVAVANKSSADTSRRVKRAHRRNAELGRSRAKRCFGYRPEPTGQKLKSGKPEHELVQVPEEAAALRWAYEAILGGATLYAVGKRWDDLGLRRVGAGGHWRGVQGRVRETLLAGRNAGIATVAGKEDRSIETRWKAIVDVETLDQVRAVLSAPGRGLPVDRPVRASALSGLLRCHCGAPMRSWTSHGSRKADPKRKVGRVPAFRCASLGNGGRCYTSIRAGVVEELVEQAVVQTLLATDQEAFAEGPADRSEMAAVRAAMAGVGTERSEMLALRADGLVTAADLRSRLTVLAERERALEARWEAVSRRVAPAAVVRSAGTDLLDLDDADVDARSDALLARWLDTDLAVRRRVIDALLEVTILKAAPGGHDLRGRVQIQARATGELLAL